MTEDRFFDPEPSVRSIARELYTEVKNLAIVSPHGHCDPAWFSGNRPFENPTELIIIPDHYIFRMLYSQGHSMESLGVPTQDGTEVESDPRKIWQLFAENYFLFGGTPTGAWLNHVFSFVFGITERLDSDSAMHVYDQILEKLQSAEYRPRALFDRFNIEVLTTTDAAESNLEHHARIRESNWNGNIIPCFRPDGVTDLSKSDWRENIERLSAVSDVEISSYANFIEALEKQREFFKEMGAVSTDHGVTSPCTHELSVSDAERLFQKALRGEASATDAEQFTAHMLMEMARMSVEDGLVMQIHPGSFRNHNQQVSVRFGLDKGADIPLPTEYTRNLYELLNRCGNEPNFTLIVFTLDESTYSRELAPLAGHYPALKLGPPWWFHDSIEGMKQFRECVTETAGIYNTVGFNDDTRAFPSIPARHDLARRMDCNYLAGLVARHIIDVGEARTMSEALAYNLVKRAYNL
jgi:glucuronate isomerase